MPKKIDLNNPRGPSRITMMIVGASRSGKTHFAARFPRPLFLSDATESGWTTIQHMEDDQFYEPGVLPQVWSIESPKEMMEAIMEAEAQLRKDPSSIGTLVIDSITFYAEAYFAQLEGEHSGKRYDPRQLYSNLASHLRWLMIRIHQLPVNVLWLTLAKEGSEGDSLGGVSIPGQTAVKAPARCDIWCFLEQLYKGPKQPQIFRMHTQNYAGFKAGHRFGSMLPAVIENPSYLQMEELLQLEPWVNRFEKPKLKKKSAPVAPHRRSVAVVTAGQPS